VDFRLTSILAGHKLQITEERRTLLADSAARFFVDSDSPKKHRLTPVRECGKARFGGLFLLVAS
jgi:hypothetical protein